jgi:hypothetical protein
MNHIKTTVGTKKDSHNNKITKWRGIEKEKGPYMPVFIANKSQQPSLNKIILHSQN